MFRKPHVERDSIGYIDWSKGREESIRLPKGRIIERIMLGLSFVTTRTLAFTSRRIYGGPLNMIDRLTVEVGGDEIWRLSGAALQAVMQMDYGQAEFKFADGHLLSDTTVKNQFYVALSFDHPTMLQPLLNGLDLRGSPDAFLKIYWNNDPGQTVYGSANDVVFSDVECEVVLDSRANTPADLGLLPVRTFHMMDHRVYEDRDRELITIKRGTSMNLSRIGIISSRDKLVVDRYPWGPDPDPILDGRVEVRSGTTKWRDNNLRYDWAWSQIQNARTDQLGLDVVTLPRYGNRAELVPTNEIGDDVIIESAVKGPLAPGEECLLRVLLEGTRAPRWPVAQRAA